MCITKKGEVNMKDEDIPIRFVYAEDGGKNSTAYENFMYEVLEMVDNKVRDAYTESIFDEHDISTLDLIVALSSNLFANLSHFLMIEEDIQKRIEVFRRVNNYLCKVNEKLFLGLQTSTANKDIRN